MKNITQRQVKKFVLISMNSGLVIGVFSNRTRLFEEIIKISDDYIDGSTKKSKYMNLYRELNVLDLGKFISLDSEKKPDKFKLFLILENQTYYYPQMNIFE